MNKIYTVIRFDTEDFLSPQADDATKKLADILISLNARGNFNITGKKVETLLKRKRDDVIKSLLFHDISYHSYGHSIHPTVREYLKYMDWKEGVEEFIRRENKGINCIKYAFGRMPSGYGQAGGTWTPHAYGAMKKLGIPVYIGGGVYVKIGLVPCWYCGILQMRTDMNGNFNNLDKIMKYHQKSYERAKSEGGGLLNFCAHDANYVTNTWWDGLNFSDGNNPAEKEWKIPNPYSKEKQEELLSIFREYVKYVLSFDNSEIVTPSELPRLYKDKTKEKEFSPKELISLSIAFLDGIDFQKTDVGYVSASEIFALFISSISTFLKTGKFPQKTYTKDILGPMRRNKTDEDLSKINTEVFLKSILDTENYIEYHGCIPSEIWVGSVAISPVDYITTLSYYFPQFAKGDIPKEFSIKKGNLFSEKYLVNKQIIKELWQWLDPKGKFKAPNFVELAKLQTWTIKPATLA